MTPDIDIHRAANVVIKQYGEKARLHATMRADALLISKAGNRLARVAMVEAAWLWVRHQPDSALTRWFHNRTQGQKGRIRCVMIVALARKLAIALWRYLETGLIPEGAVVK
jgi:transposase